MNKNEIIFELANISNCLRSLIDKNKSKILYSFNPKNINGEINGYILKIIEEFDVKDVGKIFALYSQYIGSALNMFSSSLSIFNIIFKEDDNHNCMDAMFALSRTVTEATIKMHYITYTNQKESGRYLLASSLSESMKLYKRAQNDIEFEEARKMFSDVMSHNQNVLIKLDFPTEPDISKYNKAERKKILSVVNLDMSSIHKKSLPNIENSYKDLKMVEYKNSAQTLYKFYEYGNSFVHLSTISNLIDSKNKHFWVAYTYVNSILLSMSLLIKLIPKNKSKKILKDFDLILNDFLKLQPEIVKNWNK